MTFLDRVAKYLFILSAVFLTIGGAFVYGVVASSKDLQPVPLLRTVLVDIGNIGLFDEVPFSVRNHLQPSRGQGNGVTKNVTDDDNLVFMMGFFDGENQARLIERDGTIIQRWSLDYLKHFPDAESRPCAASSPLDVDTHGALVTPHGELVFNYEYCGTVKLTQCGEVVWAVDEYTHHSVTRAEKGGYWVLGRTLWEPSHEPDRFRPFSATLSTGTIKEDTILRISEDGEILERTSIPELMREGGLLPILTATGSSFDAGSVGPDEPVHANKIAELSSRFSDSFPLFRAGDLMISMRELNFIMVIDRETHAVKWHQTGPWLRQHDPEFRSDGRISVFNNNTFSTAYKNRRTDLSTPFSTNIILVDPATSETEVRFGESTGQEMLSVIRGQHELLPDGGMIITEFDGGRVIEVDGSGMIVWEYVNQFNDQYVGEITNADLFPRNFFGNNLAGFDTCQ